ncbi:Zinc finger BED domain-containing protein 4 [Labeo rohita]|uniref:Zinc finger BED domain-containing protein 4 n=1 Tax=Labeo rohita TaxID=84645 RepID=A0ABQ8L033_LABRO|nr:Zinc finger BED domain-containing protein 4 [Labeo rohita]
MSAVWTYFSISEKDPRIAICKTCNAEISRGGASAKTFSTSGLIYHLKSKHPDRCAEYERNTAQKRKTPPSTPTPSVVDVFEKARKFPSDSVKAKGITPKIMELIALDDQPFSVVEDVGFCRLIEHIEPCYAMPSRRHFLRAAKEFRGSHTAAASMFDTWHIDQPKGHAIVSDNARNMAKAIEDSQLKGIQCMAHTLHLVVSEGVLSQRSVKDILAIGRRIVGHFKHSQLAYSRLQSMHDQFGTQIKRFQQDQVLAAYSADHELPATFTSHQWVLIENVLSLLAPFEQLTKASVADVIPLMAALKRLLSKEVETDHGNLSTHFTEICSDPLHFIATVLDPSYKDHYLDAEIKQRAREMIQTAMDAENPRGDGEGAVHSAGEDQSAEKKTRLSAPDEEHAPSLSDMFNLVGTGFIEQFFNFIIQPDALHRLQKFSAMGNSLSALKEHGYSLVSQQENKILVKNEGGDQFVIKKLSANQHCEGGDLAQKIKNKRNGNATFSEIEILDWIVKLCMALKYLHDQQILHKNLQPKV